MLSRMRTVRSCSKRSRSSVARSVSAARTQPSFGSASTISWSPRAWDRGFSSRTTPWTSAFGSTGSQASGAASRPSAISSSGQENPVTLTAQNSFDEVQDYVSLNRHSVGSQLVVMNADAWNGLSGEQQTALTEAVRDARADNLECAQAEEQEVLDEWEAAGTPEVIEDVDVEAFRTRAQDYFLNNLEGEQLELYQDIRDSSGQG